MYKLMSYNKESFKILDTLDMIIESVPAKDILGAVSMGLQVDGIPPNGVSIKNIRCPNTYDMGKYLVSVLKPGETWGRSLLDRVKDLTVAIWYKAEDKWRYCYSFDYDMFINHKSSLTCSNWCITYEDILCITSMLKAARDCGDF